MAARKAPAAKTVTNDRNKALEVALSQIDKQFGKVWEKSVVLMDVESFNENTEFEQILGYINTAVESQKKGVTGDVK